MFQMVDLSWKEIMRRTNENPNAIKAGTFPGLRETLQKHNANLDKIEKRLEDYLETKRTAFPRYCYVTCIDYCVYITMSSVILTVCLLMIFYNISGSIYLCKCLCF